MPIRSSAMLQNSKEVERALVNDKTTMITERSEAYVLEKLAMNKQIDGISNAGIVAMVS